MSMKFNVALPVRARGAACDSVRPLSPLFFRQLIEQHHAGIVAGGELTAWHREKVLRLFVAAREASGASHPYATFSALRSSSLDVSTISSYLEMIPSIEAASDTSSLKSFSDCHGSLLSLSELSPELIPIHT